LLVVKPLVAEPCNLVVAVGTRLKLHPIGLVVQQHLHLLNILLLLAVVVLLLLIAVNSLLVAVVLVDIAHL
jgi:hypothetical protein